MVQYSPKVFPAIAVAVIAVVNAFQPQLRFVTSTAIAVGEAAIAFRPNAIAFRPNAIAFKAKRNAV